MWQGPYLKKEKVTGLFYCDGEAVPYVKGWHKNVCLSNLILSKFLFIFNLSPHFLSSLICLPVTFPNNSFPFSPCVQWKPGHLSGFTLEHHTPAINTLSLLLTLAPNKNINVGLVINKLQRNPRRTSSFGLVLTGLVVDKEMMECDSGELLNSRWIPVAVFLRRSGRGELLAKARLFNLE